MEKNRKGFTLIELLAVIVVLAIIALIATPIILGIIEDTRKDAFLRSVELVISSTDLDVMNKLTDTGHEYKVVDGKISDSSEVTYVIGDKMEENNLNILTNDVPNNEVLENGFVGEASISQENMGVNPISDIEVVSEVQPEVVAENYQSQEVMQPVESSNMSEIVENNNVATVMNQESYNSNSEMLSENMVVEPQAISEEIPTNINNVQEQNSTEAQPVVTEVKVSGTASEEEILRDATKPPVEDLDISRNSIIVLVKRKNKALIPNGNMILREGDTVFLYTQMHLSDVNEIDM